MTPFQGSFDLVVPYQDYSIDSPVVKKSPHTGAPFSGVCVYTQRYQPLQFFWIFVIFSWNSCILSKNFKNYRKKNMQIKFYDGIFTTILLDGGILLLHHQKQAGSNSSNFTSSMCSFVICNWRTV